MALSDEAAEECEALSAIYGDDCSVNAAEGTAEIHLPSRESCPRLVVRAHFPHAYPSGEPPLVELQVPRHVSEDMARWAAEELVRIFVPGKQD